MRERLMFEVPLPEILRSKLESIILNLKLLHVDKPYEFLKTLISVPDEKAVNHGLNLLKRFVSNIFLIALNPSINKRFLIL